MTRRGVPDGSRRVAKDPSLLGTGLGGRVPSGTLASNTAYTGAVASLRPWTPPARTVGGVLVGQDPPPRSERAPLDHAPSRGPGRTGGRFTHDSADNALPPGTQLDSEGYGDPGDPTY